MRSHFIVGLVMLLGGSIATSPWHRTSSVSATILVGQDNPIPVSEESITAGRTIYVRFCASCHGTRGLGDGAAAISDTKPANLVDDEWTHGSTDAEIFKTIAEGVPPEYAMEEWLGRVSEEDIWNVINYLRSLAAD
jgi:mono/diheme cytochrome c family protein